MKNNYQIFWNHIDKSTFMYGTVLRKNDTQVCFTNHQTPSGIPLHIWRAKTSFYNDRTTPSLPLLKRGQAYHIKFIYDVRPSSGIYFKIEFFRRNNEV
ncbi:accessory Sec system protein Asp3, partial [Macrococcoides bohemicum]|uniref:accessory Sec system protein Asp3 n=1 Tax=Macrococcoides bohemicum TaxID=1903056 RepID=UPI00289BE281